MIKMINPLLWLLERYNHPYYVIYTNNAWNLIKEIAGRPATPEVTSWRLEDTSYPKVYLNIPLEDVDGNQMSPAKLFYRIFIDIEGEIQQLTFTPDDYKYMTETMTEIPYTYNDNYDIYEGGSVVYLNQELDYAAINRVGVQSVYYGGMDVPDPVPGEDSELAPNESPINWAEVKPYSTDGVTDVIGTDKVESVRYYNVAGVSSDEPFDGINIVVKKMADGSTKVEKVNK